MQTYYEEGRAVSYDSYGHEFSLNSESPNGFKQWHYSLPGQWHNAARTGPAIYKNSRWHFIMAESLTIKLKVNLTNITKR